MTRAYEVTVDGDTYRVFESTQTTVGNTRSPVAVFKTIDSDVADSYMGHPPDVDGEAVVYVGDPSSDDTTLSELTDLHVGVLSVLETHDVTVIDVPVHTVEMTRGDTHRFMDFSKYKRVSTDTPDQIPA